MLVAYSIIGLMDVLKCELLNITNQRSPLKFTYHINNVPIKEVDFVKYLGVVIDSIIWKEHIKQVLSKSNTSLVFLRRNLRACSCNIKEHCYRGLNSICHTIAHFSSSAKSL